VRLRGSIGMPVERTPVPASTAPAVGDRFPFGVDYQAALLKILAQDGSFASAVMPHLKPEFFENEVYGWAFARMQEYRVKYESVPSLRLVCEQTRALDTRAREFFRLTLERVLEADLSAEAWLRDTVIDFVKRHLFVAAFHESKAFFNAGNVVKSYDSMYQAMDRIFHTQWETVDRCFFFEELPQRMTYRLGSDAHADAMPTGIPELDHVLSGGLKKGELGIWVAYPKRGKSTMLVNLGAQGVRRANMRVLHFVLEGSRKMVENRYDSVFAQEEYWRIKDGSLSTESWQRLQYEYQVYRSKLVIRGLTERWTYSVADLQEEIRELKQRYNWDPDALVVDYGDLLRAREENMRSETEVQRAAFRDLKTFANRGYVLWSASQAQRPKDDIDVSPEILQARRVADCYDKIRVADFIGSINQTQEEREARQARLYAELYRDNAAGQVILVYADFAKMTIASAAAFGSMTPVGAVAGVSPVVPLGYVKPVTPTQMRAPI